MGQGMPKSASLPPKDTNKGTIVKQAKRRKLAIPPSQPHLQISKPSSGERMSEDDLKLVVGSSHWVSREVEGEYPCLAQIIETRKDAHGNLEYYVHFCNFDKRLDTWITADRFLSHQKAQEYGKNLSKAGTDLTGLQGTLTRNLRRKFEETGRMQRAQSSSREAEIEQFERDHEEITRVKNIQHIQIGQYEIDCWYFSPYPNRYSSSIDTLYICEHCLKYMSQVETLAAHRFHSMAILEGKTPRTPEYDCFHAGPPGGTLIYLHNGLAVFEIDGEKDKLYCQNLSLMAKLFLDHKALYYDVSPFIFYVLCEMEEGQTKDNVHFCGYFSKEKESPDNYNLACIMILPPHQKKGYGRFLIELSYELTRRQGRTGSPEKPLSDLGVVSYRSFWSHELLLLLKNHLASSKLRLPPSIDEMSSATGFTKEDITDTLKHLGLLRRWRDQMVFNITPKIIQTLLEKYEGKQRATLEKECVIWQK